MKYPLTNGAKEAAQRLVELWRNEQIEQIFVIGLSSDSSGTHMFAYEGADNNDLKGITIANLRELSTFGLIDIRISVLDRLQQNWDLLLLQELVNAVDNDFEVSEYFLTMNAVGAIIQGSVNVQSGGTFQSAASNLGDVTLNNAQLADKLTETLSESFLESQAALKDAIDELRESAEVDREPKVGKVISQLGHSLEHGANTAAVVAALMVLARLLGVA